MLTVKMCRNKAVDEEDNLFSSPMFPPGLVLLTRAPGHSNEREYTRASSPFSATVPCQLVLIGLSEQSGWVKQNENFGTAT